MPGCGVQLHHCYDVLIGPGLCIVFLSFTVYPISPPTLPAMFGTANAAAPRHTLSVKTCDHQYSQTRDTLHISFCAGPSNCTMGRKNAYNVDGTTLNIPGTWSVLEVPLEYEPTTMLIENEGGIDGW